jgi:tryptophan synthase alpha chain
MYSKWRRSMGDAAPPGGRRQLEAAFREARGEGRALLLPYLTAGLPDPDHSIELFVAMAEAGADGFEVGIPYSDPLMDGPVIHEAGLRAIGSGTDLNRALEIVAGVVAETGKPTIVMSYVNPVSRLGLDEFAARVAESGAAAVILADLPAEESRPFRSAFEAVDLGMVLFAAPTTGPDRLAQIAAAAPAFIYGIADLGVTGERAVASTHAAALSARVREAAEDTPLVLGVGISTPAQAAAAACVADGVIVGSALVRRVLDAADPTAASRALSVAVGELAAAVRSPH